MNSFLKEKMRTSLVVLPSPPQELISLNPFVLCNFTHNNSILNLLLTDQKGLIIRLHPQNTNNPILPIPTDKKVSFGCFFIPAPNFDKVFMIKNAENLSRSGASEQIYTSIQHQLRILNRILKFSGASADCRNKLDVQVLICTLNQVEKTEIFKKFKSLLDKYHLDNRDISYIRPIFMYRRKENLADVFKDSSAYRTRHSDCVEKLIGYYIEHLKYDELYFPKPEIKLLNGQPIKIDQVDKVVETFHFFFPNRDAQLESVPPFNRIWDNMLYSYTDQGKLGKFNHYSIYMGEVRYFSEQLLAKIKNPCGVLIRNFSNKNLEAIATLESCESPQFQIDWLYLRKEGIVAFEVGLSEKPEQCQQSSVRNKIMQCLKIIIPQMQIMLYSFWRLYQKEKTETMTSFGDLLKSALKVVIYLPNIKYDTFVAEIECIKEEYQGRHGTSSLSELVSLLDKNWENIINYLSFLVRSSSSGNLLWHRMNKKCDLERVGYNCTIYQLFEKPHPTKLDSNLNVKNSFINYVSACFVSASLCLSGVISNQNEATEKTPLDIDERFLASFKSWKEKNVHEAFKYSAQFNLVLSPQQHRILCDQTKRHLIITGHPGCGKTSLLLAKCEQMAWRRDVHSIFYFYGINKYLFRKYLNNFIENNCSQNLKRKLEVKGFKDFESLSNMLRQICGQTAEVIIEKSTCSNQSVIWYKIFENIKKSLSIFLQNKTL